MPVIRIGDATWKRLKSWAEPLEDSPDDALRKVLDAAEEHRDCLRGQHPSVPLEKANGTPEETRRVVGRKKQPEAAYERPILKTLYEMGGRGNMEEVLRRVEAKMKHLLTDIDHEPVPSGRDIRWRNTAMWERFQMIKRGLLRNDSPKGEWELTEEGNRAAESLEPH